MGDGEIVVCGAETPGSVRFKAEVVDLLIEESEVRSQESEGIGS